MANVNAISWASIVAMNPVNQMIPEIIPERTLERFPERYSYKFPNIFPKSFPKKFVQKPENNSNQFESKLTNEDYHVNSQPYGHVEGHPPYDSIIEYNDFHYLYLGAYHDPKFHEKHSENKTKITICIGIYAIDYDDSAINYMLVSKVFKHEEKYYTIPTAFSLRGFLEPSLKWTLIEVRDTTSYPIHDLPYEICTEVCPGYL